VWLEAGGGVGAAGLNVGLRMGGGVCAEESA
jgi:hypothetical protein